MVSRRLGTLLSVVAVAGLVVTACGGNGATASSTPGASPAGQESPMASPTPTASPTPVPTPTASPTEPPALKTIEDLLAADHPTVKSAAVETALETSFAANTDAVQLDPYWQNGFHECSVADPNVPANWIDRQFACENEILGLMKDYWATRDENFFDTALLVYNYAIHAKGLETAGGGTSGSLEPFKPTLDAFLRKNA